jgi:hypothetical protein
MIMNKLIKSLSLVLGLLLFTGTAHANLPWGSTAPLQVSGATPTCTYTATALACIENMTAPVTAITLAGMTAGTNYTLILMQDGTGSRTLAQASVTGAPALVAAESAANGYAVWVIQATSASAATFVADYSNADLTGVFKSVITSNGSAIAPAATASQSAAIVAPGVSAATACLCQAQTLPATWSTGIVLSCLPATNSVTCMATNEGPTNTFTPAAISINVRLVGP